MKSNNVKRVRTVGFLLAIVMTISFAGCASEKKVDSFDSESITATETVIREVTTATTTEAVVPEQDQDISETVEATVETTQPFEGSKDEAEGIYTSAALHSNSGTYSDSSHVSEQDALMVVPDPTQTEIRETEAVETEPSKTEIAKQESVHVHNYTAIETVAPSCDKAGYCVYSCPCGDRHTDTVGSAVGHRWGEWIVTQEPTTEQDGVKNRTCGVCGMVCVGTVPKLVPEPKGEITDPNYYGKLYVPDAGIEVSLYKGSSQEIVNGKDSAAIFDCGGLVIADHSNQEFEKLFDVSAGTTGYIELANGETVNLNCQNTVSGYNKKTDLTDKDGNSVLGQANYTMYTCENIYGGVYVCQWEVVPGSTESSGNQESVPPTVSAERPESEG